MKNKIEKHSSNFLYKNVIAKFQKSSTIKILKNYNLTNKNI
jgi:hypothetical protein